MTTPEWGVYHTPKRNKSQIRWVGARVHHAIDMATEEMHDEISKKYYESWYWAKSDPWGPFDTVGHAIGDKEQFDLLCAMVDCMHLVSFHNCNSQIYQNDPNSPHVVHPDEYRWLYSDGGTTRYDLVQEARDNMDIYTAALGVGTAQMVQHYKDRVKHYTGYDITMDPVNPPDPVTNADFYSSSKLAPAP